MQYLGGKKRIAKQIVKFLAPYIPKSKYYFEPFVGSGAVLEKITGIKRYASDKNEYLIELYKALQNGWIPPETISEEEYAYVKNHLEENKPLTAFVGIGCSFGGKWFGGYARNERKMNYAKGCSSTLLKQLPKIKDVCFDYKDYKDCHPKNALIYCDPPYSGTTGYGAIGEFNHEEFWEIMREWSKTNIVVISEYQAPQNFKCVLEIKTRTNLGNKENKMIPRIERLFMIKEDTKDE